MAQVIPLRDRQVADAGRCQAVTSSGKQCRNRAVAESGFCRVHLPPAPERVGPFSAQTVQEFLDFLRDRITGNYEVDGFGFDRELTERFWLPLLEPPRYVAVDIAAAALEPALARLATAFPDVEFTGVVTDFSRSLDLAEDLDAGPATFFYPGSSIGNFSPDEAVKLLTEVRRFCGRGGGLFIGVDTEKEPARLQAAYDDALGVTAAFNRNALNHVNALIGADFDPAAFAHIAFYNAAQRRIEMHLEARSAQRLHIAGRERTFAKGERIHTENSYKYAPETFARLLRRAGFVGISMWQDPAGDFAVFYAE